jgi:starch-binding outer membrane protein, SusD/RagB family
MKKIYKILIVITLVLSITFSSCMEFLDKTDLASVTSEEIFSNFFSYQGFVETMYSAIVIPQKATTNRVQNDMNDGDDMEVSWPAVEWANGNYMYLVNNMTVSYLYSDRTDHEKDLQFVVDNNSYPHTVWGGWRAIRAANLGIKNLEMLKGATEEQKDLLAGQCYFFRGYFHWEIMRAWGAIPYVDRFLYPDSDLKIPVLNFHETAEKVMADLELALDLLPIHWDMTAVGAELMPNNEGRLTKGMVLSFMAEVMLYCGSPMINGTVTKNYSYDIDYCKRSAAYAWELIKMAEEQGVYKLAPYDSISHIFYRMDGKIGGLNEHIFRGISRNNDRFKVSVLYNFQHMGGGAHFGSPTANYVENYGMANGLPIDDPESGFNPASPFTGRDPRFYNDLRIDRDRILISRNDATAYAQLYVNGRDKGHPNSLTGYGYKKFIGLGANTIDNAWGTNGANYWVCVPRIRLAEIYLFYAEAANEAYGPNGSHPGASLTAVQALNRVRNRAGVPDLHNKYTTSIEAFRERVWNERAVELAFEYKRWYDIRRWYVAHLPKHKLFYSLDFDKDWTYFQKRLINTRTFDQKHYWLPFPTAQVNIYKDWPQNPGW